MKVKQKKRKARELQNKTKQLLESIFKDLSFKTAVMGESGSDIKIFPTQLFSIEVKHHKDNLIKEDNTPSTTVIKQAKKLIEKENTKFCLIVLKENYKKTKYYLLFRDGSISCLEEDRLNELLEFL